MDSTAASDLKETQQTKTRFARALSSTSSNWPVFLFLLSVMSALIGWTVFHISPLQPLQEIANRQKQEELKNKMIERHFQLANLFLNISKPKAAQAEFDSILKLQSYNSDAQYGIMKAEIMQSIQSKDYDPETTEQRLKLIEKEKSDDPHILLFKGQVYSPIDPDSAIKHFDRAIAKDSTLAAAYYGKGVIYDSRKQTKEAISMYQKALEYSPWNQLYALNLGYQYMIDKQYENVIEIDERTINLYYKYLAPYYDLTRAYLLTGNLNKAYQHQKDLIALLEDKSIAEMETNNTPWLFVTDSGDVILYQFSEKKSYAYYSMALLAYLKFEPKPCEVYIGKARQLELPREVENKVKKLLGFDIETYDAKIETLTDNGKFTPEKKREQKTQLRRFNVKYLELNH